MKQLMAALNRGVNGSSVLIIIAAFGVCYYLLNGIPGVVWWGVAMSVVVGLVSGVIIGKATELLYQLRLRSDPGSGEEFADRCRYRDYFRCG